MGVVVVDLWCQYHRALTACTVKTQIQAVSLKIQTLKSTNTMANAMKGVTKAMGRMNATMNIPAMQKIMMEFEKQSEVSRNTRLARLCLNPAVVSQRLTRDRQVMDMKSEMMEDAIDDVMGDEDEDEER